MRENFSLQRNVNKRKIIASLLILYALFLIFKKCVAKKSDRETKAYVIIVHSAINK